MKGKDNGTNNASAKEKVKGTIYPQEIEAQFEIKNKKLINDNSMLKNVEDDKKIRLTELNKDKSKQINENNYREENKNMQSDLTSITSINNINNFIKNENNDLNIKNCINNIDFDKNIITINKQNLQNIHKELNNINKEIKTEKKNEIFNKKGESINIVINEGIINYNKELNNSIKLSYGHFLDDFSSSNDNFGQIKFNSEFPKEVIEKFFQKKRNKYKEKNINNENYISSFGNNPLESIKDIQNNILEPGKMSSKHLKINQKNLKEQNNLLQKYIKSFPVLNCPESKIFKINKNYFFNKINNDKIIFNNRYNKNIKNNMNLNNNIKDKEESEEETIYRHIKKKFINKKRNKS